MSKPKFDRNYARRKLELVLRDLRDYNADEFWREISRIASGATGLPSAEHLKGHAKELEAINLGLTKTLVEMTAPAVQGEPAAYAVFAGNGNIRIWCADPVQVESLRQQYGESLQPLYAAPPPAEKQPAPDASESKATTPKESWRAGYRAGKGLLANTPRQDAIAAPDVAKLVEALKACRDELRWMIERHNHQNQNDGSWLYDYQAVEEAHAALAAYRKQGGSTCS